MGFSSKVLTPPFGIVYGATGWQIYKPTRQNLDLERCLYFPFIGGLEWKNTNPQIFEQQLGRAMYTKTMEWPRYNEGRK